MSKVIKHRDRVRLDKSERTPQGYLRTPAYLTRTGVLKYRMNDGSVLKELRHPDDVFDAESMSSLHNLPLTNEHPKGLLDAKNTRNHMIGWVGSKVEPEGIYLKSDATIVDDDSITDVENGKQEVSCGYTADLEESPGVYNGEPYDVRQRNIRYNHVSLVRKGRAGENVKLRLDADESQLIEDGDETPAEEKPQMGKIKVGEKEFDASQEVCDAFADLKKKMDAAQAKCDEMSSQMDKSGKEAAGKMDAAQAKLDNAEAELKTLKTKLDSTDKGDEFNKAVAARVSLEKTASALVKEAKFDGKSDIEIMREVILAKHPETKLDGKSDVYIQARYDHVLEVVAADDKSQADLNDKNRTRKDGDGGEVKFDSAAARAKMVEESRNAYKSTSPISKQ